jgi:hypothetical protein
MTAPRPAPPLKSPTAPTTGLQAAEQPGPYAGGKAPKVVAEGVPSAVLPDPRPADGRRPVAWLHIVAPSDWSMPPRAFSRCDCGRNLSALGRARVLALIADHTAHRDLCPVRHPASERSRAA